jgi:hypothetical protein
MKGASWRPSRGNGELLDETDAHQDRVATHRDLKIGKKPGVRPGRGGDGAIEIAAERFDPTGPVLPDRVPAGRQGVDPPANGGSVSCAKKCTHGVEAA